MTRYYFHVHDGQDIIDSEGLDLPDWPTALREAVRLAGALIAESADHFGSDGRWSMEVADGQARVLLRLDFTATLSAGRYGLP